MTNVPGRSPAFLVVIGVALGAVLTGITVPYLRTERVVTAQTSAASSQVQSDASSPAGGPADAVGSAASSSGTAGPGGPAAPAGSGPQAGTPTTSRSGSSGPTPGGAAALDVGVTADSVKIGIAIIDIGAAKSLGFAFDLGDQRARYQALIDDQNAKGGINGRRIVPDYRTIDAAGHPVESAQAACIAWTKDVKVFAILAETNWGQAATVCATGPGNTVVVTTDGVDKSYYQNGLYWSTQANDNRILVDQARYLESKGKLKGKKIGILVGEGSERVPVDNTLVPTLAQMGYSVADIEVVPATTSGTQKIPIAVSNFKAKGVDLVIIAANVILAGPFVQSAHRSGYDPEYALSDFNNEINDQVASYYPDAFDGTVGLSTHRFPEYRAGMPVPPADQRCFDRVAKADPKIVPYQNSAHEVGLGECAIFDALVGGATKAGQNLTRATFIRGMESLGSFGIPSTQDGSFGPGKHDAVDLEREVVWHKTCTCWELLPGAPVRRMG